MMPGSTWVSVQFIFTVQKKKPIVRMKQFLFSICVKSEYNASNAYCWIVSDSILRVEHPFQVQAYEIWLMSCPLLFEDHFALSSCFTCESDLLCSWILLRSRGDWVSEKILPMLVKNKPGGLYDCHCEGEHKLVRGTSLLNFPHKCLCQWSEVHDSDGT